MFTSYTHLPPTAASKVDRMAERPTLKLKLSNKTVKPEQTDTSTGASKKLTLKLGTPKTPGPPKNTSESETKKPTKSGRKPKATAKKRAIDEAEADSDPEPLAQSKSAETSQPQAKKFKLTAKPRTVSNSTYVKIKTTGRIPERPMGVGYDSEDDDREEDPTIDHDFILRMLPGEDCNYLRKAVAENLFRTKENEQKGAKIHMRFLTKDSRRAVITIQGRKYAAILVDLACILEAMKSWDKKNFYKSADVSQMLLVLGRCQTEEEAITYPLPTQTGELDEKTWQWAHGITPPMRWARKRRFRKRLSTRAVEEDEREVERLLTADANAISSKYRQLTDEQYEHEMNQAAYESEEDAEGDSDDGWAGDAVMESTELSQLDPLVEVKGEADEAGEADDSAMAVDFEAEMERHAAADTNFDNALGDAPSSAPLMSAGMITDSPIATPASSSFGAIVATTPGGDSSANSPAGNIEEGVDDEDDDDDESDGDEGDSDIDDDLLEQQQDQQRQREEIADLEAAIAREEQRLLTTGNAILQAKITKTITALKHDLSIKKGAGEADGED